MASHTACLGLCALVAFAGPAFAQFPDAHGAPPPGWDGPVFALSQDYPNELPPAEELPWQSIDFRTEPGRYLAQVLAYVLEGNLEVDWVVQENPVRSWYHAPWMQWGPNGREFLHGLTRERTSRPGELHANQTRCAQNWAVGIYNPPGGYVLGQVWRDPEAPDASLARFPEGTVAAKLLFTAARVEQVPYLHGGPAWDADIHVIPESDVQCRSRGQRAVQPVRLLQLDVAVRDARADDTTGWVFGTFVYNGDRPGATGWERLAPVGLMWGNDPDLTPATYDGGARPQEGWINDNVGAPQHLGSLGRLNGPVDSPESSCLSCHATAQVPSISPMVPPFNLDHDAKMRWFQNVKAGEPFDAAAVSADYALQVSMGIQNLEKAREAELVASAEATLTQRLAVARRAAEIAEADVTTVIGQTSERLWIYRVTRGR